MGIFFNKLGDFNATSETRCDLPGETERKSNYLDMVVCQRHVSRVRSGGNHIVSVG